jgi:hypothetical protein
MKKNINGTNFDIDFCKRFNEDKLRKIYNGESTETLNLLIAEIYPKVKAKK